MAETIRLTYHSTQRDLADAMIAAGNALARKKMDWPFVVSSAVAIWLSCVGGLAIASAIWMSALDREGSSLPWMIGGAVAGFLVIRYAYKRMVWVQAGMLLKSRFGSAEQQMELSAGGVVLRNETANWQTDWTGVEAVVTTKSGLAVVVSGIALPVPNAAFESGPTKKEVLEQSEMWRTAARS